MQSLVTISNEATRAVRGGKLWLPKSVVVGRIPKIASIARIFTRKKECLGTAFLSPCSRYFLRMISSLPEIPDRTFWQGKIIAAHERRRPLFSVTDAYRILHAEADGIPSVIIDQYNDVFAIQIGSSGAETIRKDLIEIIRSEFFPASIIEKNDSWIRKEEGLPLSDRIVLGEKNIAEVREGSEQFEINVLAGQKTGAYLDYRGFRLKAKEIAYGKCLDAFCYQGWFSAQIASHVTSVVAIDSSAAALGAARKNAERNKHGNITFIKADAMEFLGRCDERFDFIHLDPPSFAKGAASLEVALRGYRKLLATALPLLLPDGILMVSSCSHAITEAKLEKVLLESVEAAGRKIDIIFRGRQDIDHPILPGHKESLYLKAVAVKLS